MTFLDRLPMRSLSPLMRACVLIVVGYLIVVGIGLGVYFQVEQNSLREWSRKHDRWVAPLVVHRVQEYFPGIETPKTVPASESTLAPDDLVIGIEADGKSRAYRRNSLMGFTDHVVNDMMGEVAVSVTYCDLADCIRAFGGEGYRKPLEIAQGGLLDNRMVLRVARSGYMQETGERIETDPGAKPVPFPYAEYPTTLTTWGEWKAQHPDTDVYEGIERQQ